MTNPIPAPAPQPFTPATPTGLIYAASAFSPASGVSGEGFYNGPWVITTQMLDLNYFRVPEYLFIQTEVLSLSGGSIDNGMGGTALAYKGQAIWTSTSSNDAYPVTGTVSQPQKFEFFPVSADIYGNNYGDLTASTLGPQGTVRTIIPFYERRLMTAAEQAAGWVNETSSITIANFQTGASGCHYSLGGYTQNFDQNNYVSDFKMWAGDKNYPRPPGLYEVARDKWNHFSSPGTNYKLGGAYATNQENLLGVLSFITEVGQNVQNIRLEQIPSQRDFPGNSSGWCPDFAPESCIGYIGIPEYDPTRHDYT